MPAPGDMGLTDIDDEAPQAAGRVGQDDERTEARPGKPAIKPYVNANHKLVVYMTLGFRMRDGASASRVGETIARMDRLGTKVPAEGPDIAAFASLLAERLSAALKGGVEDEDGVGLMLAVAQEVFGLDNISFVEQIALDVATEDMVELAERTGDAKRGLNSIAAEILRSTAEVLRTSIEPRK